MKKYSVLIVLSLAQFILVIDTTMMNVAITRVTQDLNTTLPSMQLAIALYAAVMAAFMITGGKLGNIFGTKRIFIIGLVLYSIGTLTAALSVNIAMLTAGWSFVEGVGAALMLPAITWFLMTTYQGRDRVIAFAVFSAIAVGGAAIGPIIGGFFTTYLSWRWAFGLEFPVAMIVLAFSGILAGKSNPERPKLDVLGVILSAISLFAIVLGLVLGNEYGWWVAKKAFVMGGLEIAPFVLSIAPVLMITGGILLLLFMLWQRRQERKGNEPLIPTSLFKNRHFMMGNTVALMQFASIAALLFSIPVFLQQMLLKNAIETGVALLPMTLAMLILTFVTVRLVVKVPIKYVLVGGMAIGIAGVILLAYSFSVGMTTTDLIAGLILIGCGAGLVTSQLDNLTISFAKPRETNEASGAYNMFANLGNSLGTALIGTILVALLMSGLIAGINNSKILPPENKAELNILLTDTVNHMETEDFEAEIERVLGDYPDEYIEELDVVIDDAGVNAMRGVNYAIAGMLGVGLIASVFLPRRKLVPSADEATGST